METRTRYAVFVLLFVLGGLCVLTQDARFHAQSAEMTLARWDVQSRNYFGVP
jgi:hypothetical protein